MVYLGQGLLHGGPVGHPPGALQHQVGVGVALGLAVLCQRLPLVQLLGAPGPREKTQGKQVRGAGEETATHTHTE